MDMFYAIGQQIDDLIGGIGNACLFHGFRIVSEAVYDILNRSGTLQPDSFTAFFTCTPRVMGMMPGTMGTVIPASRTRYMKLKKILLSKNIWVVRYSHPASTFPSAPEYPHSYLQNQDAPPDSRHRQRRNLRSL